MFDISAIEKAMSTNKVDKELAMDTTDVCLDLPEHKESTDETADSMNTGIDHATPVE